MFLARSGFVLSAERGIEIAFSASESRPASMPWLLEAAVRGKQIDLLGFSNFGLAMDELRRGYLELLEHAAAGRVRLPVETFTLDRIADAWERQAAGPGGKVVVRL